MKGNRNIIELKKLLLKMETIHISFDYLSITIASPARIKSWSSRLLPDGQLSGEILTTRMLNPDTEEPEPDGLFCQKIFGPVKNWHCQCGKYTGFAGDKVCEVCFVEIIDTRVRRYRMGYIELSSPVSHIWYLNGMPSYLSMVLQVFNVNPMVGKSHRLTSGALQKLIYSFEEIAISHPLYKFSSLETTFTELIEQFKLFSENTNTERRLDSTIPLDNDDNKNYYFKNKRKGAEILKAALDSINFKEELQRLRLKLQSKYISHDSFILYTRQIRLFESFIATGIDPSWMILTTLPVLPPSLRPYLKFESTNVMVSDLNELYHLILVRSQYLSTLDSSTKITSIAWQAQLLLQEAVDALIDNAHLSTEKKVCLNGRDLKSLTEILEGKKGRFRQHVFGKRVDYSGRAVIIVGPNLSINTCGLPYIIAVNIFEPLLENLLLERQKEKNKLRFVIGLTDSKIKKGNPKLWGLLRSFMKDFTILLNRAPTLHRLSFRALDPILVFGNAIHIPPLLCSGFNADFDGDQMAIYLPLSTTTQLEIRTLMRPSYNLLCPSNGHLALTPSQDIVMGCFYLTLMIRKNSFFIQKTFSTPDEVLLAFFQKKITLHTPVLLRYEASSVKVRVRNKRFYISGLHTALAISEVEVRLYKQFSHGLLLKTYFLVTNIGILCLDKVDKKDYKILNLFLEMTPGRLLFSLSFKYLIKNTLC